MASHFDNIVLDGQKVQVVDGDIFINGLSLRESILNSVIAEAKFIKEFHNEIRAKGSAVHNKLAQKFSFHEQLEAIFSAFEGDTGKLNQIIQELKTIKQEN